MSHSKIFQTELFHLLQTLMVPWMFAWKLALCTL